MASAGNWMVLFSRDTLPCLWGLPVLKESRLALSTVLTVLCLFVVKQHNSVMFQLYDGVGK